jgi:hypothetical protein
VTRSAVDERGGGQRGRDSARVSSEVGGSEEGGGGSAGCDTESGGGGVGRVGEDEGGMGGTGLLVLSRDGGTGEGGKCRQGGRRSETASIAVESGGVLKALSGAGEVVRRLAPRHPSTLLLLLSLTRRPLPLHLLVNLSPDVGETLARSECPTRAAPCECS